MECIILWVFGNKKSYESEQHPVLLYKMSHSWIEYLNERYSNWEAESKHNDKTTDNHDNRLTHSQRERRGEKVTAYLCSQVVSSGQVFEAKQAVPLAGTPSAGVVVHNLTEKNI